MFPRFLHHLHASTVRVTGTVAAEGVCAERAMPDAHWTARVRLAPWSRPGCAPTHEALHLTLTTTPHELQELQRDWAPGTAVHAIVRIRGGTLQGELVRRVSS
ncbi:hypothetical protein DWG18_01365 [Lysobacter sp. TY2-98]|uniref:hypothetical protein n=1 Tax=Lysobacter sp. TY2-98 TaxID=2290922 RepID=UPI000E209487|nr:hypothetical protein [Lysobacter sp. TY2-98]AXK71067.1 hypothetical protein DWG18_01365 [Lysobacter sp. TY2-98]